MSGVAETIAGRRRVPRGSLTSAAGRGMAVDEGEGDAVPFEPLASAPVEALVVGAVLEFAEGCVLVLVDGEPLVVELGEPLVVVLGEPLAVVVGDVPVVGEAPARGAAAPLGWAATATASTLPSLETTYQLPPLDSRAAGTYSLMCTRSVPGKSRLTDTRATNGKPESAARTRPVVTRKRFEPRKLRRRAPSRALSCAGRAPLKTMWRTRNVPDVRPQTKTPSGTATMSTTSTAVRTGCRRRAPLSLIARRRRLRAARRRGPPAAARRRAPRRRRRS